VSIPYFAAGVQLAVAPSASCALSLSSADLTHRRLWKSLNSYFAKRLAQLQ
jgi:hypothetical protein